MSYPICKKCGKEMMNATDTEIVSVAFDGVNRIYKCECGMKCQATYNFELIEPDNIFWEDEE